jgi:2,3-dihydroxybenzoate-AMP ligase
MLEGCPPFPAEFAQRYIRKGYWRAETITQAVAAAAKLRSDTIAVADDRRKLSLREVADEAASFRVLLERNGMRRGDRIVIQVPNCAEFAGLLLACLDLGVLPVMALPAFRRAELEYLVSFSQARAIAIAPVNRNFDHAALARELKEVSAGLELIFSTAPADGCISLGTRPGSAPEIGRTGTGDPFEVALFLLSGGTTGMPKLIARTHADYLYNARAATEMCALDASSRILLALPAEHNFPLAAPGLLGALLCGATAVFSQSTQAADIASAIEREAITHLPCVPTMAMALAELPSDSHAMLRSLRVITVGGQKLQEPTARKLRSNYPWLIVQQVFGMAEGLICYTRLDDPDDIACTTQGRPMSPADELRIVDADGNEVREGEVGELWCRGPYTIRGYYRAPERNTEAFTADGFYRTGDLVRRGAGGNLVVEGRVKDLINRGGEKISAEEIEAHLLAHPAVMVAAVVPMPDAALGEKACAYVKLRPGARLDLAAVREHLEARGVARFKWPERVEIVLEMPLTNVGKIKKSDLRADIERKLERERSA